MATLHAQSALDLQRGERRFFFILSAAMAGTIVAGFSLNLAMGRSTFAVPLAYHAHAVIFMGWLAFFLVQAWTMATGRRAMHRRLGRVASYYVPVMVLAGIAIMVVVARRTGGPFFFAQNEFFVSNVALLLCFGVLALWALRVPRQIGWHRRLLICALTILTGPGLGRLLPLPLMIPYAWPLTIAATLVFPAIAMAGDLRRHGRIHPAYLWGTGVYIATFVASMLIAYSPLGYALTRAVVAGSPGAERPMGAFLPPGFAG